MSSSVSGPNSSPQSISNLDYLQQISGVNTTTTTQQQQAIQQQQALADQSAKTADVSNQTARRNLKNVNQKL